MTTWKEIKTVYNKAYQQIQKEKPNLSTLLHKTIAVCVAQLVCDDPRQPDNKRASYLTKLLTISGGPTIREHGCMWKAFGRGDSVRHNDYITSFETDQRFPLPGTWDYNTAYNFSVAEVLAPLSLLHCIISKYEYYFDDTQEDLRTLQELCNYYQKELAQLDEQQSRTRDPEA